MAKEFMAEIEAFCMQMGLMMGNWSFDLNMDLSRKHYDDDQPIVADDLSSGNEAKLSISIAIDMGDERVAKMEANIRDYKAAKQTMMVAMGMELPILGRRYDVASDPDGLYFVTVEGKDSTKMTFESFNGAELYAGYLAKRYVKRYGKTATYKEHPDSDGRCWVVD